MIRPATANDAAAVGAVIVAAGQAAWSHIFDVTQVSGDPVRWAREIAAAEGFWVGEDDGRVLGFSAAGEAEGEPPHVGELLLLHVRPDAWGTGVADALHDTALAFLAGTGRTEARLRTEERNHRALAFYARRGWTPDGTVVEREFAGAPLREPWLRRPTFVL